MDFTCRFSTVTPCLCLKESVGIFCCSLVLKYPFWEGDLVQKYWLIFQIFPKYLLAFIRIFRPIFYSLDTDLAWEPKGCRLSFSTDNSMQRGLVAGNEPVHLVHLSRIQNPWSGSQGCQSLHVPMSIYIYCVSFVVVFQGYMCKIESGFLIILHAFVSLNA